MITTRTILTVLAAGLALVVAGCGQNSTDSSKQAASTAKAASTPAAPARTLDVKLSDFKIAPSATTVAAGGLTVKATNDGPSPHELVFIKTDKPAQALGSGAKVSEKGSVGEIAEFPAGKTMTKVIKLNPGKYVMICNVPGHYTDGMHAPLTVAPEAP